MNHQQLNVSPVVVDVNHSKQGANEIAMQMIDNGTIGIGTYSYTGQWIVADCRYDVLLNMPCYMKEHPNADYVEQSVLVGEQLLRATLVARSTGLKVSNLQVKRFRRLLRRPKQGLEVFRVVGVCSLQVIPCIRAKATLLNDNDA